MFISFEGGERSGKSTQARLLAQWLAASGYGVVFVREPGSTPLGQRLRRLVKGTGMSPAAELLLFGAARAELVTTVLRPHLAEGRIIVADRYSDSTVAYQQYGRQMQPARVREAIDLATEGLKPDITFLLDLPPSRQQRRSSQAQITMDQAERPAEMEDGTQTRFERESLAFHQRVREGYRAMAKAEPQRWVVLDAGESIPAIHERIQKNVLPRLPKPPAGAPPLLDLTQMDE